MGGHSRGGDLSGFGGQQPPSLIREEDENTSLSSIATDMYPVIVSDDDDDEDRLNIQVSPVPPSRPRPRIVQRMMLENQDDTMLPWSSYTNVEAIIRSRDAEEGEAVASGRGRGATNRLKIIQNQIRFPSIVVHNPYQKSNRLLEEGLAGDGVERFAEEVMNDDRYRVFFPHVDHPDEVNCFFSLSLVI